MEGIACLPTSFFPLTTSFHIKFRNTWNWRFRKRSKTRRWKKYVIWIKFVLEDCKKQLRLRRFQNLILLSKGRTIKKKKVKLFLLSSVRHYYCFFSNLPLYLSVKSTMCKINENSIKIQWWQIQIFSFFASFYYFLR